MATATRRNSSNGNSAKQKGAKQKRKQEYQEEPGWGSAFHRPENESPQPMYTGTGVLDRELAKAILETDGEFQIAVWPKRASTGTKYLRVHIEPIYQGGGEDDDLDDDDFDGPAGDGDDDDTPF